MGSNRKAKTATPDRVKALAAGKSGVLKMNVALRSDGILSLRCGADILAGKREPEISAGLSSQMVGNWIRRRVSMAMIS